jgi:hypothetical protein
MQENLAVRGAGFWSITSVLVPLCYRVCLGADVSSNRERAKMQENLAVSGCKGPHVAMFLQDGPVSDMVA